ncbi:MAG: PRC-barrel domain-containing protein [Pseudomonadota bacterium]
MPSANKQVSSIRASTIIGAGISSPTGESIGNVQELIIDDQSEELLFAVVSFGAAIVANDNYYPVPWRTLERDEENGSYMVPFTRDQLGDAPSGSMQDMTDKNGGQLRDAAQEFYRSLV